MNDLILSAIRTLNTESQAILDLKNRIENNPNFGFDSAIFMINNCFASHGRVIISGMGKSGHIARKIAATMSSTGTPSYFVHPAEAIHGDLGMITQNDLLVAISYSGECEELLKILPIIKRQGAKCIAMTGKENSSLAKAADLHLDCKVSQEACPFNLAPTSSTTTTLALGDALAIALLENKGFSKEDFARSHPGGSLGKKLLTRVSDVMRCENLPLIDKNTTLQETLLKMSAGGLGLVIVVDDLENQKLCGIFTDGDLRRSFLNNNVSEILQKSISNFMQTKPQIISPEKLATAAVEMMQRLRINALIVCENNRIVGALNMHDLFKAGVL